MDRRTALTALFSPSASRAVKTAPAPPLSGLEPYAGPWTYNEAGHLLRRTTFGPTYDRVRSAVESGLPATIDQLFAPIPLPDPPINYKYTDPNVPQGETWVDASYGGGSLSSLMSYRTRSLYAWTIGRFWEEGISIREKLTLFWHNHFPIERILDPKYMYRYGHTLRSNAWGNFRELAKAVTIDPAMLRYLDGRKNHKNAPNENYARELLELFTIGKGPQVGPGDYTNYTEQDVQEIARALTGWVDRGYTTNDANGVIGAEFISTRHDTGVKTLSHRFGNAEITNQGEQEYAYVIDLIFQQSEPARFICRRLYTWFVYYQIDNTVEANVIEPMAQLLLDNDYEIEPALRALLSSQHFFDAQRLGGMIKNPLDFLMSIAKPLAVRISDPVDQQYDSWYRLWRMPQLMQMEYYNVPEVAGWNAYYLEPLFYRNWISASTLLVRKEVVDDLLLNGVNPFQGNGDTIQADLLELVTTLEEPADPNAVVAEMTRILLPRPLPDSRLTDLKEILLDGLPDFEWTVEYGAYAQDPAGSGLADSIEQRLRSLAYAILTMPEFHLS